MKRYLLAIQYSNNKPEGFILGNFPWSGTYNVDLKNSLKYKDSIENLGITDNFDLVGYSGELNRYTYIDLDTGNYVNISLVVLAKSTNSKGDIYFVTDGLEDPYWASIDELKENIQKNGYRIANARIVESPNGNSEVKLIKGELDTIDFTEYQLEYRKYLKEKKGKMQ